MKKREVMKPLPPKVEKVEETPVPKADLDDKEIFELPPPKVEKEPPLPPVEEVPPIEEVPSTSEKVKPKRDYSHLTAARAKSIEARRKKAEDKKKLDKDAQEYKERLEYEKLCKKYGKTPVPENLPPPPSVGTVSTSIEETSYKHKGSARVEADTRDSMYDYDKIINGVAGKLQKNEQYFKQLETDIRADERRKTEDTYKTQMRKWEQDQHRKHQADQAYGILSGSARKNQVFERTRNIRDTYTQRYKQGWYKY